jgi:RNA polymerase sigma-70 factor, ECF subfamily
VDTPAETALVLAAQAGDGQAFDTLVGKYRRELLVHCYRLVGSVHDAEDLVQETLVRAWEKRATFTRLGSFRAWLYRIATNLCLNALTRVPRRSLPPATRPQADPALPLPPPQREPIWLEPFPDDLLADLAADPEHYALQRESITLAFLTVLQQLTPEQRAILVLREVLDWPASEVAEWLDLSVPAVNSALQRARGALHLQNVFLDAPAPLANPRLQSLLERYVAVWEQSDIPGLVALLKEDAWFTMPPLPAWFQGRDAIAMLFRTAIFVAPSHQEWRLLPVHANASSGFAIYHWDAEAGMYQLFGLLVLSVVGEQISNTVAFLDPSSLTFFALPPTLAP